MAEIKFAKIENMETMAVSVGLGTDEEFYQSIGMEKMSVEQSWDGGWYLEGYAPEKSDEIKSEEVRALRNQYLKETDVYMIADYPILDEERELYKSYRTYLRDITEDPEFPNVVVKTLEEWK